MKKALLLLSLPFLTGVACQGQDDRFLPEVQGERVDREGYTMIWDGDRRFPKIIAYELTREELTGRESCGDRYHADPDLNEYGEQEYIGAADLGFERGHLLPASQGRWSTGSCLHTSYYSNIMPQRDSLNRGGWMEGDKRVEALVTEHGKVYVHAGPIPMYLSTLPSGMRRSVGFWKVIVYEDDGIWRKESYLFTQSTKRYPLESYECGDDLVIEWLIGFEPYQRSAIDPLPRPAVLESIKGLSIQDVMDSGERKNIYAVLGQSDAGLPKGMKAQMLLMVLRDASTWTSEWADATVQEEGFSCTGKLLIEFDGVSKTPLYMEAAAAFEKAAAIGLTWMEEPVDLESDPEDMTKQQKVVADHFLFGAISAWRAGDCGVAKELALKALQVNVNLDEPMLVYLECSKGQ